MVLINKTPKILRPGRAVLKEGQTYQVHMGKSCFDGVLCCAVLGTCKVNCDGG